MQEIKPRIWSKWDGGQKDYTKDCEKCAFYRKIDNNMFCGWGAAFKYLNEIKKLKRCNLIKREPPQYQSIKYLDEIILKK